MTVGEVIKMFVERLVDSVEKPHEWVTRICRKCVRHGDAPVYYAFDRPGDCARCRQNTQPRDSVAIDYVHVEGPRV